MVDVHSGLNYASPTDMAISDIKQFEPPEGYWLGFSGGKDSICLLKLADQAGVKYEAHMSIVGCEPPELIYFVRKYYPQVIIDKPRAGIFKLAISNGLPTRLNRWCCKELKENGGSGRVVLTGVRKQESNRRKKRNVFEECYTDKTKMFCNPILEWKTEDVWWYIEVKNAPFPNLYLKGFKRLGCIGCPFDYHRKETLKLYPRIANAWRKVAIKSWERQTDGMKKFKSGDEYYHWWISNKRMKDPAQAVMFE